MGDIQQEKLGEETRAEVGLSQDCQPSGGTWASSVPDLASSRSASDAGSPSHELIIGTNGLTFNGLPAGKVYVNKYLNTGVWLEEWFVENPDMLLDFKTGDFLQISWESSKSDSGAHTLVSPKPAVSPNAAVEGTHKAVVDYVYLNLPTQTEVDKLDPKTTTQTFIDLKINGRESGSSPAVETGALLRMIDTAGGKTVITEHWVLFANYEPPTNNYDRIELSRVDAYTDLTHFMSKMIDKQGTEKGWLYVQVSYTLDPVLP